MKAKLLVPSLIAAALISACGSTPPTPEERAMANQMQKAFLAKLQGMTVPAAAQQQAAPAAKPEVLLSAAELAEQKQKVDATGGPAIFYRKKDGIMIDGQMFNDFEGQVANFGGNRFTGEFTYAVENFDGSFTLKYHKAHSSEAPIKIGTVWKRGGQFEVRTVTGKKATGNSVIPTSDGFIVGRSGSAFRYFIDGDSVKNITLLDNYHIAEHQKGDAASTGFILLEKDPRDENDKVGGFFDSFKELGNTFGLNKFDDYVLVSIDGYTTVPMDVGLGGKEIAEHSNCKRQNAVMNKCENVEFKESLYTKLGLPNYSHYYWSINWVQTQSGPMAIYRTSTKVKIVDINNKQVHTVFSRTLGVNDFVVIENADGTTGIRARLGFSKEEVKDIESFIRNNTTDIEPMQTLQSS
ncbi:hypothetical protein I533_08725 [Alteromonas mediterranea MED64]|uniref:hypothetical protein n=1 Tax=Alteromonas mediterranea TaxID=314275 RepID=UPI000355650C|nr:hypothetical protein [Alteromonas mediterranea]AGP81718.1 hypothetical protein I533_08725 [Alteromonas mediterranea MED64]